MKKTFIVGVCVLAFTNFLFLTFATTDLLPAAGCGASTAAGCQYGSFVLCMAVLQNFCSVCYTGGGAIQNGGCYAWAFCEDDFESDGESKSCALGGGSPF